MRMEIVFHPLIVVDVHISIALCQKKFPHPFIFNRLLLMWEMSLQQHQINLKIVLKSKFHLNHKLSNLSISEICVTGDGDKITL
jgi:hypothetical protein